MECDVLFNTLRMICDSVGPSTQTDMWDTFVKGKTDYQVYLPVMTAADGLYAVQQ